MGVGLTLSFPISFDPVKHLDLILQLSLREVSRRCIFDNAHTSTARKEDPFTHRGAEVAWTGGPLMKKGPARL